MASETTKEYWNDRSVGDAGSPLSRLAQRVKASPGGLALLSFFLSSRVADEHFLRKILTRYAPDSVLDLACGFGKPVLPANVPTVYGVDISGFPNGAAEAIGYKKAIAYDPPDYEFDLGTSVDLVTCINLNAHIPFESFGRILANGLEHLKPDGILVLIAELDNAGISYSRFADRQKKASLVQGMEHYYFEDKRSFLNKLQGMFPNLELIEERSLAAIVTLNQHYIYSRAKEPQRFMKSLILLGDTILGPINSLYTRARPNCESFLVAFVMRKRPS